MIIAISTCAERLAVHVESGHLVANVDAENRLCVVDKAIVADNNLEEGAALSHVLRCGYKS